MAKKKKETAGQPEIYTEELGSKVCTAIATSEKGLEHICKKEGMPSTSTVYNWLNDGENKDFLDKYTRARQMQADLMAEQVIEIADNPEEGEVVKIDAKGKTSIERGDMLGHRKLKIYARQWAAAKLWPNKYSERIQKDVTIHQDQPLFDDIP